MAYTPKQWVATEAITPSGLNAWETALYNHTDELLWSGRLYDGTLPIASRTITLSEAANNFNFLRFDLMSYNNENNIISHYVPMTGSPDNRVIYLMNAFTNVTPTTPIGYSLNLTFDLNNPSTSSPTMVLVSNRFIRMEGGTIQHVEGKNLSLYCLMGVWGVERITPSGGNPVAP